MNRLRSAAAGLTTLGIAALLAASTSIAPASAKQEAMLVPLIFGTKDPSLYFAFDDDLQAVGYLSLDEARRKAGWVHVDALSEPTKVVLADGSCLTNIADGTGQRAAARPCASPTPSRQLWTVNASMLSTADPVVAGQPALTYAYPTSLGIAMLAAGAQYTIFKGAENRMLPLRATVSSVDSAARTAAITGRARPNSTILIDGDPTLRVPVANDGVWSYSATALQPGRTRITFEEWVGTDRTDSVTVAVDLAVDSTFRLTSPASGSTFTPGHLEFTGTGTPGAEVSITATNFSTGVVTTTVDDTGHWSFLRVMGDGAYVFDITQTAGGVSTTITGVTLTPAS
ncbi:hypothetical protein [Frondihabitans australicus]|uniref:Bacterial Ig domain-containing protein n=1 Tax=Frondihabitans australicus TaxID=386892 RepID=A0A495IJJ2_9MICO|nr:hypothetical protein [Frondihabitans australicus]RKR76133.1 hypothetical protein C8E83_3298 [Frondihabitans australicus]